MTDAEKTTPAVMRRWPYRLLWLGSSLLVLLLGFILLLAATINSQSGRQWLTTQVVDTLNQHTPLRITLSGLQIPALGHWQAGLISLHSEGLEWLRIEQLDLRWRPYQLLDKELLIDGLSASSVIVRARDTEPEKTQESAEFTPALPWLEKIRLQQLSLERLQLHGFGSLQPDANVEQLALTGHASLRASHSLDAGLQIRRLAGLSTTLELEVHAANWRRFHLLGSLREPAGGALGRRLQLPSAQPLDSEFQLQLTTADGHLLAQVERLEFQLRDQALAATGSWEYRPADQYLELSNTRLRVGKSEHVLSGTLSQRQLDFELRINQFPLGLAQIWIADIKGGQLNADLKLRGSVDEPRLSGQLDASTRYRGEAAEISLQTTSVVGQLNFQELAARLGDAHLSGHGSLDWPSLQASFELTGDNISSSHLRLFNVPLPQDLGFNLRQVSGQIHGLLKNPDADLVLQAVGDYRNQPFSLQGDLRKRGLLLSTAELQLQLPSEQAIVRAGGQLDINNLLADLDVDATALPLSLLELVDVQLADDLTAELNTRLHIGGPLRAPGVEGEATLEGVYRQVPFASAANGSWSKTKSQLDNLTLNLQGHPVMSGNLMLAGDQIQLQMTTSQLQTTDFPFLQWPLPAGTLQGQLQASGKIQNPVASGELHYATRVQGYNEDKELVTLPLQWQIKPRHENSNLQIHSIIKLADNAAEIFDLQADTKALLDYLFQPEPAVPFADLPLQLKANGGLNLQTVGLFLPDNSQTLSGQLKADVQLSGRVGSPLLHGRTQLLDASYTNYATGTVIDRVDCTLISEQSHLKFQDCQGRDGQRGKLQLQGTLDLPAGGSAGEANLELTSKKAALLRKPELEGEISGKIQLRGDFERLQAAGELEVSPFVAILESSLTHNIPTIEVHDKVAEIDDEQEPKQSALPRVELDIRLFANKQAYLRGRGLDAELEGELRITGSAQEPVYTGKFSTLRGSFKVFNTKFELEKGVLNFNNNAMAVSIQGVFEKSDLSIEALLSGTNDELKLSFTSTPAMPEDEIVSYIIFGKSIHDMSPIEAVQLAAAVNSLRGGGGFDPIDSTRELLGADTLYIESDSTSEEQNGVSVGVGKYINEKVYLEVERTPNPSQPWKGRIEIELTPRLNLESSTGGTSGIEGAALKWKKNY